MSGALPCATGESDARAPIKMAPRPKPCDQFEQGGQSLSSCTYACVLQADPSSARDASELTDSSPFCSKCQSLCTLQYECDTATMILSLTGQVSRPVTDSHMQRFPATGITADLLCTLTI